MVTLAFIVIVVMLIAKRTEPGRGRLPRCTRCGRDCAAHAKFCGQCGAALLTAADRHMTRSQARAMQRRDRAFARATRARDRLVGRALRD